MISALYFSPIDWKNFDRLVARHDLAVHGRSFFASSAIFFSIAAQVFWRERALVGEVVVEAVLDHRPDRDLRLGEQLLHRVREQVRGRVAQDVDALRRSSRDDRDVGIRSMR